MIETLLLARRVGRVPMSRKPRRGRPATCYLLLRADNLYVRLGARSLAPYVGAGVEGGFLIVLSLIFSLDLSSS